MSERIPVFLCGQQVDAQRYACMAKHVDRLGEVSKSLVILVSAEHLPGRSEIRVMRIPGVLNQHPQACVCCSGGSALATVLRDSFLQALRRQIPRFSQVVLEVAAGLEVPAIRNLLRYDAFLSQRYCVASVAADDAVVSHSTASSDANGLRLFT